MGGVEALVKAVGYHGDSAAAQDAVCGALRNLVNRNGGLLRSVQAGVTCASCGCGAEKDARPRPP